MELALLISLQQFIQITSTIPGLNHILSGEFKHHTNNPIDIEYIPSSAKDMLKSLSSEVEELLKLSEQLLSTDERPSVLSTASLASSTTSSLKYPNPV